MSPTGSASGIPLVDGSRSISMSLLDRVKARDPDAWRRLVQLCGPMVYAWCRRSGVPAADAADVTQEVFRAVVGSVASFRRQGPEDSFCGWLWTVTRNKIRDHFRACHTLPLAQGGSEAQQRLLLEKPGRLPEELAQKAQALLDERARWARRQLELNWVDEGTFRAPLTIPYSGWQGRTIRLYDAAAEAAKALAGKPQSVRR